MKLFSDAVERDAVATILAGTLLIADVVNRGLPAEDDLEGARDYRIARAFRLARQFTAYAENSAEQSGPHCFSETA